MPKTQQAVEQAAKLKLYLPQLDKLEERLLEWTAQEKYQALVIKAMRHGVPIFEGTYGTSTNEYGVHMDTIFSVASNTKPIIATLIMILLEEGRLELENPIKKFIPEYDGGGRENIQLWHFLTHSSGIVDGEYYDAADEYILSEYGIDKPKNDMTDEEWEERDNKIRIAMGLPDDFDYNKLGDILALRIPLKHEPRSLMSYCNHGYNMLKEVICAVSGETIDAFAQRVLFNPLGMVDSHWKLPEEKWGRVLGRNERCTGYGWINTEGNYNRESGAGGLKTTAVDMSRFCEMILGNGRYNDQRILSPASIRQMTKNYNTTFANPFDSWGLGFNYRGQKVDDAGVLRSEISLDHGGWAGHKLMIDPEHGVSVITYLGEYSDDVFSNYGRINNMIIAAFEE